MKKSNLRDNGNNIRGDHRSNSHNFNTKNSSNSKKNLSNVGKNAKTSKKISQANDVGGFLFPALIDPVCEDNDNDDGILIGCVGKVSMDGIDLDLMSTRWP